VEQRELDSTVVLSAGGDQEGAASTHEPEVPAERPTRRDTLPVAEPKGAGAPGGRRRTARGVPRGGGEVLATIETELAKSRAQPQDLEILTTIRRGFHTLKGSGAWSG
jgi:chemosensory pili system protein ChpA (sensor histidine kinase/response regulator)